ncbi:hypothetical protein J6590_064705 [Homalodisca vitripennis]|nr:hypothetical protein J6590_064705 [Homalodisca vitripennis]
MSILQLRSLSCLLAFLYWAEFVVVIIPESTREEKEARDQSSCHSHHTRPKITIYMLHLTNLRCLGHVRLANCQLAAVVQVMSVGHVRSSGPRPCQGLL